MKGKGQAPLTPAVLKDYDDQDRSLTTPDVGADEFNYNGTFWLGGTSGFPNDWNTAANWCSNSVPTNSTNVIIPNGVANYPIITAAGAATALANSITIGTSASIIINSTGALTASGSFVNNGSFTNNGLITLNGNTAAQTFPGAAGTIVAMNNITVNNTSGLSPAITFNKNFTLTGTMTPTAGIINLGNAIVTLKSDNTTGTANVAEVKAAAGFAYSGTGKFIIERYIRAKRAWRLLTSPTTAATGQTINAAWQEGAIKVPMGTATVASDPFPGYGTHISGGTAANGYDANTTGNASVKTFNAALNQWENMPVTVSLYSKKVTDEKGYMLFVRGSRTLDLTNGVAVVPDNTTLRTAGQLNVYPVASPLTVTGTGFTVVGNPFASAIDFNRIATLSGLTDAQKVYYLWDPTLNGSRNVGGWVTLAYNTVSGKYDRTVITTNDYTSVTPGDQGIDDIGTIQSGAAFMMDFTGFSSISLDETIKKSGSTNLTFRPVRQLRTNLYSLRDGVKSLADAVLVTVDNSYSNNTDAYDVKKLPNFTENISIRKNTGAIAIERRKSFVANDSIGLQLKQMSVQNYQFEFVPDGRIASPGVVCFLVDKFLHQRIPVSLTQPSVIPFAITTDVQSASPDRFTMQFKNRRIIPPFIFSLLQAAEQSAGTLVQWITKEETNIHSLEVEKSADGISFASQYAVNSKGGQNNKYQWLDVVKLTTADCFYRIKIIDNDGEIQYSNSIKVSSKVNTPGIAVYPNPVVDGVFGLQLQSMPAGEYQLSIINHLGQLVQRTMIEHSGGNAARIIPANSKIIQGNYLLEFAGKNTGIKTQVKIVVL